MISWIQREDESRDEIDVDVDDRTAWARRKQRRLVRHDWIDSVMQQTHQLARSLEGCNQSELRQHTETLRKCVRAKSESERHHALSLAAAVVMVAIDQKLSMKLFDVQLRAGLVISCDAVAEMQTGEGKTLSGVLPAYVKALAGKGVHVATPNHYLASRDQRKLAPVFGALGVSSGLIGEDSTPEESRAAYRADITYGPGHVFGFDYLRDQLTLSALDDPSSNVGASAAQGSSPVDGPISGSLGLSTLRRISGCHEESRLLQRGLHASIVDEIDHVLIDDAVSPLLLSGGGDREARDAVIHHAAREMASELESDIHYRIEGRRPPRLTDRGFDRVYEDQGMAIHARLIRPWHEYVTLALRASAQLQPNVDYIVRDGDVRIIDPSTGRIFDDRTWSDGLHQAVQAREGLRVTSEKQALARITRQRFYRYYRSLGGMTGTASGCETEFAAVYGLPVVVIPLRVPCRRRRLPDHLSIQHRDKFQAIAEEAESCSRQGRAVLIGTQSIAESHAVAEQLAARGLCYELLNGVQDADEALVISRAGQSHAITVATNLAGRGTDITLDPEVAARGGLHVIVTQMHSLARVDRQLIGRCARCGDPGSTRVYLSAEDRLIREHAPWVGRAIRRSLERDGPERPDLNSRLLRVQRRLQSAESARRWSLLQQDRATEQLVNRNQQTPRGCWQL